MSPIDIEYLIDEAIEGYRERVNYRDLDAYEIEQIEQAVRENVRDEEAV